MSTQPIGTNYSPTNSSTAQRRTDSEKSVGKISHLVLPSEVERESEITGVSQKEILQATLKKVQEYYQQLMTGLGEKSESTEPLTEREALQVLELTNGFHSHLRIALANQGIQPPTVHFPKNSLLADETIDFSVGLTARFSWNDFKKINKLLNQELIDPKSPLNRGKNSKILGKQMKAEFRTFSKAFSEAKHDTTGIVQAEVKMLLEYKKAIGFIIKDSKSKFLKEVNESIDKLKNCDVAVLKQQIVESIRSNYLEKVLKKEILQKMQMLIMEHVTEFTQVPVSFQKFAIQVDENFDNMGMMSPFEEWVRAVKGGCIIVYDQNDKVLLAPFKKVEGESEEESEKRVNEWALEITKVVSKGVFKDENLLLTCFEAVQKIANQMFPKEKFEGFNLKVHQALFQKLMDLMQDPNKMAELIQGVDAELKKKNPSCEFNAGEIIQTILQFYRAPSQTLIWGLTGAFLSVFRAIFPDLDGIKTSVDWDSDQQHQIRIKFNKTNTQFNFLKRGFIEGFIEGEGLWLQNLQLSRPIPRSEEGTIPVSANFYYKYSDDFSVSEEEKEKISWLSYVMQAWGLPDFLRDKTKD